MLLVFFKGGTDRSGIDRHLETPFSHFPGFNKICRINCIGGKKSEVGLFPTNLETSHALVLTWPSPDLHFDGLPPPLPHRPAPSLHFDRLVPGDRASLHFIELARLHGGRSL